MHWNHWHHWMEYSREQVSLHKERIPNVARFFRSTISTMSGYTPGQLVFSKDMIMQSVVTADWEIIKRLKRQSSEDKNARENRGRVDHWYRPGDKILIIVKCDEITSKLASPTEGPYQVLKVYRNGTIKVRRGSYDEVIHIRRVKPFHT